MDYLFERNNHESAASYMRGKVILGQKEFKTLAPHLKSRALAVAGVESETTLANIREYLASVNEGEDWEEVKKKVIIQVAPACGLSVESAPYMSVEEIQQAVNRAHNKAELVMRTNISQATSAAKVAVLDANKDIFTHWQYMTMGESGVRDAHAALDGKIIRADSPFWDTHTPPWDFNCRCSFAGVDSQEVAEKTEEEQAKGSLSDAEREVLTDAQLSQLAQGSLMAGGKVIDVRTPRQKEGEEGYEFNPRVGGK